MLALGVALLAGVWLGWIEYCKYINRQLQSRFMTGALKYREKDPNEKEIDQG